MQNLGFAFALIPLFREKNTTPRDKAETLIRHLQMFNTHPYLSSAIIGAVVRMEEDRKPDEDASSIVQLKQSLMGPYAAIGDTFFWGALRPFAGILSVILAWLGWSLAPLLFVLVYVPVQFWIRLRGFQEGYRRGRQGIEFIRRLELPRLAMRLKWFSLVGLAGCGLWLLRHGYMEALGWSWVALSLASLAVILTCWWLIQKGISQIYLLYGAVILLMIVSLRDVLLWK